MARKKKEFEWLPTSKIRLDIWFKQLKLDLCEQGYISNLNTSLYQICKSTPGLDYLPEEGKTLENWVRKEHYPTGNNLDRLIDVSNFSGKWLVTERVEDGLHRFLNALDYYLCSIRPEIQPRLFKKDEQQQFAEVCLGDIANIWKIPFVSENEEVYRVQDVSISMLKTHDSSSIPLYLSSIASNRKVTGDESLAWYLDLLSATLVVSANYYRENIVIDFGYQTQYTEKALFLGTCPNLLSAIGKFFVILDHSVVTSFKLAAYQGFDEISDSTQLLEEILKGNIKLRKKLSEMGTSFEQIKDLIVDVQIQAGLGSVELLPELQKNKISKQREFFEYEPINHNDEIIYDLYPEGDEPTRLIKTVIRNGRRMKPEFIACRHPDRANDNHYSWGYAGTGVQFMAYTILYDFCNHKRFKYEKAPPSNWQQGLLLYKLLSRLYLGFKYSISSTQIMSALNTPVIEEPRDINPEVDRNYFDCIK
jgi:hypothetical protein